MLETHLMIERPERHVGEFVKAGAHSVTFHVEATAHVAYTADMIRGDGAGVGVAINPATSPTALEEVAGDLDLALCMTVNPGWGGQPFIEHSLEKIPRVRAIVGDGAAVEVDGGIDPDTAARCRSAGASVFVAGSAIFDAAEPGEAYREIALAVGAE
jgi:ribulose-phosphate 3-epimerase